MAEAPAPYRFGIELNEPPPWGHPTFQKADYVPPRGKAPGEVYSSKLNPTKVRQIRARREAGESNTSLAQAYGVSCDTIWSVVTRRTWKFVR